MTHRRKTAVTTDLEHLAEDAKALIVATVELADHKVVEARERLSKALDRAKATWSRVQDRAVDKAESTDHAIRSHPFQSLSLAFGVGALLGILLARRN